MTAKQGEGKLTPDHGIREKNILSPNTLSPGQTQSQINASLEMSTRVRRLKTSGERESQVHASSRQFAKNSFQCGLARAPY